jgi:hypothetical protein
MPLPLSPEAIDPNWLTGVFRDAGILTHGAVAAVASERTGEEFGLTGVVARLRVRYEDGDTGQVPATIVAKFPMATRATVSTFTKADDRPDAELRRFRWAAREARLFAELGNRHGLAIPRPNFTGLDEATSTVVLLLEDLAPARGGDVLAGCSPEDAARVLDAIAPMHAHWWDHIDPALSAWLPPWLDDPLARQGRYDGQVERFLARYGPLLPPTTRALVDRLRTEFAALLSELDRAPATLIHGDLHLDNVVFPPERAVLLDWQSVSQGPAMIDIAAFIAGSLAPADRVRHETALLRRYHSAIVRHGVVDYPFPVLVHHYRLGLARILAGYVGWLANADPTTVTGREQALIAAAIGDGRLVGALEEHFDSSRTPLP